MVETTVRDPFGTRTLKVALPMSNQRRRTVYKRQMRGGQLTPRQQRQVRRMGAEQARRRARQRKAKG